MHNRFTELEKRFQEGQISRRDFLHSAIILGISMGAGNILSSCSPKSDEEFLFDPLETLYGVEYITTTPDLSKPVSAKPMGSPVPTKGAKAEISWYCECCNQSFKTAEALKEHAFLEHGKRLPEIKRVAYPTYKQYLVDVERFNEKNTVFYRSNWDVEYQALVAEYRAKAPVDNWERKEGKALTAGAIYVDNTAGSLHPGYYGYFGHMDGVGGLYNWDDPVNPEKLDIDDPAWMSNRIKEVAHFYGADLVGITEVDPLWVYSYYYERVSGNSGEREIPYNTAIVMGIEMDWREIDSSPSPVASAATALAYSRMAALSASIAKYIRSLGYEAIPCGNDTAQSIPLAIDAGLGELGRSGLLLSPEFGSRQRICKVFTNLPLVRDRPIDFGLQDFCENCHVCAAACPVNAIRWGERTTEQTSISNRKGILRWPVDVARCYLFWQENGTDCSNCVAACPWSLHLQRGWLAT